MRFPYDRPKTGGRVKYVVPDPRARQHGHDHPRHTAETERAGRVRVRRQTRRPAHRRNLT